MLSWVEFCRILLGLALCALIALELRAQEPVAYDDLDHIAHRYHQRPLQDPFTQLQRAIQSGATSLDSSSELVFLSSLLRALNIPVTSQMLVFSTTSLQLSLISPSNPRALYFNEDVYLGYVPGGRIEIVSIDPDLGGIYFLVDIPSSMRTLKIERSDRCMNCHATEETGQVPGLVVKSVIPGVSGGSLTSYRLGQVGHQIPLAERFGGWHLTGSSAFSNQWANSIGRMSAGVITLISNAPAQRFDWGKYPVRTSDVLPQLLHEHQAGFVNRAVEATYRTRALLHGAKNPKTPEIERALDSIAEGFVRYLLFADEAPLPSDGLSVDAAFVLEFQTTRKPTIDGLALKDLDLHGHLLKHRCSYMIYSVAFAGIPAQLKERVYHHLASALSPQLAHKTFSYLAAEERQRIRDILEQTIPDFPKSERRH